MLGRALDQPVSTILPNTGVKLLGNISNISDITTIIIIIVVAAFIIDIDQIPVSDYPMYRITLRLMVWRAHDFTIIRFLANYSGRRFLFLVEEELIVNWWVACYQCYLVLFTSLKNGWMAFVLGLLTKILRFLIFRGTRLCTLYIFWYLTRFRQISSKRTNIDFLSCAIFTFPDEVQRLWSCLLGCIKI